jgi:pimeloyl-ACP methyl ester carboxylesterase
MPRIDLDGARVAYAEAGSGETVLLLHGTASSGAQWRSLTEALASRRRVLAPDLYGYGETDPWPGDGRFALAHEAGLADAVLPPGRGPIHLVGHSYGGAVALRLAIEQPERLQSLVLIEPVAFHLLREDGADPADRRLFQEAMELAALVSKATACGDYRRAMARFVDYWNGDGAWLRTKPELQAALARRIPKVALDFRARMTEPTPGAAYGRIAVPTLVLCGARSPGPTRRIAELLAESLLASRLQRIEGAGHMLPVTHKGAVNAAVAAHLLRGMASPRRPAA